MRVILDCEPAAPNATNTRTLLKDFQYYIRDSTMLYVTTSIMHKNCRLACGYVQSRSVTNYIIPVATCSNMVAFRAPIVRCRPLQLPTVKSVANYRLLTVHNHRRNKLDNSCRYTPCGGVHCSCCCVLQIALSCPNLILTCFPP